MSDEYQIEIPASFMALYVLPGRQKPSLPRDEFARSENEHVREILTASGVNIPGYDGQ